jgi:hypothetical protein
MEVSGQLHAPAALPPGKIVEDLNFFESFKVHALHKLYNCLIKLRILMLFDL